MITSFLNMKVINTNVVKIAIVISRMSHSYNLLKR